jgi:gluconolactonase
VTRRRVSRAEHHQREQEDVVTDKDALTIDNRRTALIIQDLQNDVVSEGGAFCKGTGSAEHAAKQNVVANVARLAQAARSSQIPVIHVYFIVDAGTRGLKQNAPIFQGIKAAGAVERGSWGAAPAPGLEPADGDYVVEKMRMNAFYDTKLDILLRGLGVETLVITGAWTNMSIEHTARHGADAGYEVIVVSDGTSTLSDDWQNAALNYALTNIAVVTTVDELVGAINAD